MTTLALTKLPLADSLNMHGGWGWAWMVPMMLMMVLLWGAVVFGIFWLVRESVQRRQPAPEETALTILDRRFAEGTLSPDDYNQHRNALTGAKVPAPDKRSSSPAIGGA